MYFNQFIKNRILQFVALLFVSCSAMSQGTATSAPATAGNGSNMLAILLIITCLVLAFVIWGMGQALITISKQAMLKNKSGDKIMMIGLMIGFSLLCQIGYAQTPASAAAVVNDSPNYGGLSANNFYAFVAVICIEIAAIIFMALSIKRIYQELLPEKVSIAEKKSGLSEWWTLVDKKYFTKAVEVEKEADVLLDHNYDGIRELDNALPPWWKYGFIITVVAAFVYLIHFQVLGTGKNPTEEYATEMENARIEKELFEANNKDKVDENNIPMADAAGIKAAQVLYEANCVACHLKDGGGNVGPNLTDDYWIHKGSLNDIYQSLKIGYPEKGMQAWSNQFTPKQMSQLASYIKTLRGTKPAAPKAPQGDLYTEVIKDSLPVAPAAITIDSASLKSVK